jgi:nucleotide-binding universal stress UspA family protein
MKPFKKILVPVDFSPHSAEAIRYAADLSRRYEASVGLVHVYETIAYSVPDGFVLYTAQQLTDLYSLFTKQLDGARADAEAAGALRLSTHMLEGAPAREITQFAEAGSYDLIVMGTHGRSGLQHAFFGSVAERVLRKAVCPVLTVRLADKQN